MANSRIEGLTPGSAVAATDLFVAVETAGQSAVSKTGAQIKAWALSGALLVANNLSDVTPATARTNLGLGSAATQAAAAFLQTANNLSDVTAATARANLGLGTAATQATGTFLQTANSLSDVVAATARTNLGLATVAATGSAADLTGNLSTARLNSGTGADATTFWRGDGSWAVPAYNVPGGASLTIQYSNAGVFAGMSGTSWDDANRSLTLTGATVTTSKPVLNLSQTWNASGVTFTGLLFNATSTASAAASLLLDLQAAGTSKFNVSKAGALSTQSYVLAPGAGLGYHAAAVTVGTVELYTNSVDSPDVFLKRDAANTLALRNGVNAQASRVYNTFTDTSNGEWAEIAWASNVCYVRPKANGTGTVRLVVLQSGSTTVAGLPAAATAGAGARAFITDATSTTYLSTVAGGGSNKVPVVSDGTNWLIG